MKYRRWLPLIMPVLWLTVLGSASQVIYARHKARDMFVHLEKLNAERLARDGVGTTAAGAELLVLARLRRESRQRQAANEPAADP